MNQPTRQYRNRILASLPKPELERIVRHLTFIPLPQHKGLLDERLSCGYFLESGVASIVVTLCNGDSVEVGVAGIEALIGLSLLLGAQAPLGHTFMQIGGSGFRITALHLREAFEHCQGLRQHVLRYMQAFLTQIAQTAACNRMHTIDERLARWLLACRDRVDSDQLRLTHEFLAQMLGAPRTTVTQAAGILQRSGLIACERGAVTIADRARLEKAACECYRTVRDTYRQLDLL